jgi:hypothetical protein
MSANDTPYNKLRGRPFEQSSRDLPLRYDSDPVADSYADLIATTKEKVRAQNENHND